MLCCAALRCAVQESERSLRDLLSAAGTATASPGTARTLALAPAELQLRRLMAAHPKLPAGDGDESQEPPDMALARAVAVAFGALQGQGSASLDLRRCLRGVRSVRARAWLAEAVSAAAEGAAAAGVESGGRSTRLLALQCRVSAAEVSRSTSTGGPYPHAPRWMSATASCALCPGLPARSNGTSCKSHSPCLASAHTTGAPCTLPRYCMSWACQLRATRSRVLRQRPACWLCTGRAWTWRVSGEG